MRTITPKMNAKREKTEALKRLEIASALRTARRAIQNMLRESSPKHKTIGRG